MNFTLRETHNSSRHTLLSHDGCNLGGKKHIIVNKIDLNRVELCSETLSKNNSKKRMPVDLLYKGVILKSK